MTDPGAGTPAWRNQRALVQHFRQHGRKMGFRSVHDYDLSARATIQHGIGLTYTYYDASGPSSALPRVGYFDPSTGRFTALTEDEQVILSHFAATEGYARNLPDSTYG